MNKIPDVDLTELLHSFQDACSDKDFKKYVYGLDIHEDILMKYTSQLEESFIEYSNCLKCKNINSCSNKVKGFCYKPIKSHNIISFQYEACNKKLDELEKNAYKENVSLFELNEDMKNASLKGIYKDDKARIPIIKYFKEFIDKYNNNDNPKGMYLHGSFGSGKTYLIAALFNEFAKKNVRSTIIYYPDFLRKLKSTFNDNNEYNERFDEIEKSSLLLIDDIGAENSSNWSRDEILGPILQYRMENHLPTFFTSNLTLDELEKALSITNSGVDKVKARRIVERIKQLTEDFELISKNRRS